MDRAKRIEELRAEIAVHERHRGDGYDLSLPAGKRGLHRYHRLYRRNLDVREGVALALAEARAELAGAPSSASRRTSTRRAMRE